MPSRRHHHRRTNPIRVVLIILLTLLFVILVAAASAWYLWNRAQTLNEETMFQPMQQADIGAPTPAPTASPEPGATAPEAYDLFLNGTYYRLRTNVVAVLFMGVDSRKNEAVEDAVAIGTNQADTLLLAVFDTASGALKILHIPRDTEADVKVLDMARQYVDTERMHLCLQHAYGDGGALSCELTADAVSSLLFGIPVNRYVSMGTDGVIKAVNAIGGVTLTMEDDFSFYSHSMALGKTVKLNGKRALVYIQSRQSLGPDETDQGRMKRQVQFLKAFVATAKEKAGSNPALVLSLYEAVKDYVQTNLSLEELLFLANQGLSASFTDETLAALPGAMGTEAQPLFHMDDDAARAIVLSLFYEELPPAGAGE